jgi:hypothetical protein
LPGFTFGETGSLSAIFFAFAGPTPSIATVRFGAESFCGGGSFFAELFFAAFRGAALREAALTGMEKA